MTVCKMNRKEELNTHIYDLYVSSIRKPSEHYDKLYHDLIEECSSPNASFLSNSVLIRLRNCNPDLQKEIVSSNKRDHNVLLLACWLEKMEIIEYLITNCNADVNMRGKLTSKFPISTSNLREAFGHLSIVSPLWVAAAFRKNLPMVKFLISNGANVNAIINIETKTTVIQELCFSLDDDAEIFKYLVENGADIHKRFDFGITCLISCPHKENQFSILLKHGADINAKGYCCYTLLQNVIRRNNLERLKLSLLQGASPYARGSNNDDALQTACTNYSMDAFNYLVENVSYSHERLADAYELMGSMFAYKNEIEKAFEFWEKSLDFRKNSHVNERLLPKNFGIITKMCFPNAKELTTKEDLKMLMTDLNAVRMQVLISFERILGLWHESTIKIFQMETMSYNWPNRIFFFRRLLEVVVEQDRVVLYEFPLTIEMLLKFFIHMHESFRENQMTLNFCDIAPIFELMLLLFSKSKLFLERDSRRDIPTNSIHDCFIITLCPMYSLIMLLLDIAKTKEEETEICKLVQKLMKRTNIDEEYFKMNRLILLSSITYMKALIPLNVSASLKMLKLFLVCGADVNGRDEYNISPLNLTLTLFKKNQLSKCFATSLVKLFLDYGAHIDSPDIIGDTPAKYLVETSLIDINLTKHISLKCFAAQAIFKYNIQYTNLPAHVYDFIECHRSDVKSNPR